MKPSSLLRLLFLCVLFDFSALVSAQTSEIPSAGAKTGWTYYALLLPPSRSGGGEKWVDLNFTIVGNTSPSKKPVVNMHLKCGETMNLRSGPLTAKQGGGYDWPPIVGVLGVSASVSVLEVRSYPVAAEGTHYWIKIQRD